MTMTIMGVISTYARWQLMLNIVAAVVAALLFAGSSNTGVHGFRFRIMDTINQKQQQYNSLCRIVTTQTIPHQSALSSYDAAAISHNNLVITPFPMVEHNRIRPSLSSSTVLQQQAVVDQTHPFVVLRQQPVVVVNPYAFLGRMRLIYSNNVDWWLLKQQLRGSIMALSALSWTTTTTTTHSLVKNFYWLLPLCLCFVPMFSEYILGTPCVTPDWWKMVHLDYIIRSPDAPWVLAVYLSSNMVYFSGGWYLWSRFPPVLRKYPHRFQQQQQQSTTQSSKQTQAETRMTPKPNNQQQFASTRAMIPFGLSWSDWRPTLYTGLALYIWASGVVSATFHSMQALAGHQAHVTALAEAWCYVDHGVALSAVLYFWYVCGRPTSVYVWLLGGLGVLALALPLQPGYAWLHSLWHVLSATAAVLWAMQNHHHIGHKSSIQRDVMVGSTPSTSTHHRTEDI